LEKAQQQELLAVLKKHEDPFSGNVGTFHREFDLDVDDSKPPHCNKRPCAIPLDQQPIVKGQLDRQNKEEIIAKSPHLPSLGRACGFGIPSNSSL